MKLSFHRSHSVSVKVKKPGEIQAFVFDLALGIEGVPTQVDPQSGMLINLVIVDQRMADLRRQVESQTWNDLQSMAQTCEVFLRPPLAAQNLRLQELSFAEKRGFSFRLKNGEWSFLQKQIVTAGEELYQIEWRTPVGQTFSLMPLTIATKADLDPQSFFKAHPVVSEWTLENLQTREKSLFLRS